MSTGKVFLGILSGLAAGAMLGVLFAPDKGKVTRKKMYRKGEDYADGVKDKFNEFIDDISHKFDEVKDDVAKIAEKGKVRFNQTAKNFKTVK